MRCVVQLQVNPKLCYLYEYFCVCVCVLNSHGILKAVYCKPPHTGLHTSLVMQQWFCSPPPSGSARCCPPTPSGFRCTEYITHNRVLCKEGLNNTGMDGGEVSSTARLSRSHWTSAGSDRLSPPPSPSPTAAFPPHTWLVLAE